MLVRRSISRLATLAAATIAACTPPAPPPTRDANPAHIVIVAAPTAERAAAGRGRLGMGWYPDVEVDGSDRVHVAWTDADLGDVLYAVAPAGSATPGPPEVVASEGAAGSFVRLALGPGDAPVISFHQQDKHALRVAHRPSDLVAMRDAGGEVEVPPARARGAPAMPSAGPRWDIEDVAYGRDVGAGSALVLDARARPHLLFSVRGRRVRLARRPSTTPAFGGGARGQWDVAEVSPDAGQSPEVRTALVVRADGTEIAAYCDHQVAFGGLRVAVRPPGAPAFLEVRAGVNRDALAGVSTALWPRQDGLVDVAFTDTAAGALRVGVFDPAQPASLDEAVTVARVEGHAIAQRGRDGTLWVLGPVRAPDRAAPEDEAAREGGASEGRPRDLVLLEHPGGDPAQARRTVLERGVTGRVWMDLALRADGRPVAAWFSDELKGLKLYAP